MTVEPENEENNREKWSILKKFESAVVVIDGTIALVIPAVVALVGYSYAVEQLQIDFEARTCNLEMRLHSANARVKYFELQEELNSRPPPNFSASEAEKQKSKEKVDEIKNEMSRMRKIAKFYDESQQVGMQKSCKEIKLQALGI